MPGFLHRHRHSLCLFAICVALTTLLWWTKGWTWLGVPPINAERTPFSDTEIHLAAAVNCADGLGEWHGRVCFIPNITAIPRSQTYEPWLTLHRLGLDSMNDVYACAIVMILLFYLAIAFTLRPASWPQTILALALLFSAAIQLGIERGNFDLLIAALLCLAASLLASRHTLPAVSGIAALSITTMLKLYTGLSCLLAWMFTKASRRWTLVASTIGLILAVAVVGPTELLVLGKGAPEGGTRFSTGAQWLFKQAGPLWGGMAVFCAVVAALIAARQLNRATVPAFHRWPRRLAAFQITCLTVVPLFLLKDSYDYRLVLWLPCLALPFAWLSDPGISAPWRQFSRTVIALFLFVAAVELPCSWLERMATPHAAWTTTVVSALTYAKQFAIWVVAALFAVLFAITLKHPPTSTRIPVDPHRMMETKP